MKTLKRTCLRWTLLYFILGGLLSALVYTRFPQPRVALIAGFIAAILLWFSIGYIFGIRDRQAEARLMKQALAGERPADGEKIAVIGTISASMDILEAPMSRRRCVAYEYKAMAASTSPDDTSEGFAAIEGMALTPATIDGPRGAIRLLAVPELAFKDEVLTRVEHYDNLREYLAQTEFQQHFGIDLKRDLGQLRSVLADDDGRIRFDIQRREDFEVNALMMKEKILAPGDKVVAIGRYSAARNALVHDDDAMLYSVKITKGEPGAVASRGFVRNAMELVLGCGCLLPLLAAALLGLALVPLDRIEQQFVTKDPSWTELRVERWVKHSVRPKLGSMTPQGEWSIVLEAGQARGKMMAGGKTVRLTRATAARAGEAIDVSISGEAPDGVIARVRRDGTLESLRLAGDGAFDLSTAELETWAADDRLCNGRITALSPGDGPKVHVMFHAAIEAGH